MLWNWYTVDACFLSKSWHVTSSGMFAGSCIGVILLVMALEFLRRAASEYDAFIIRKHAAAYTSVPSQPVSDDGSAKGLDRRSDPVAPFTPSISQQAIRAFLHMMQFAVAYIVMLLAM
jgi:copper transporter 1